MSEQPTHYELLGIARDAYADEIKATYRRLVRELHPDYHPGDAAKEQRLKAVTAAYEVLRDSELRRAYDQQLAVDEARAAEARRAAEAAHRAAEIAQQFSEALTHARHRSPIVSSVAVERGGRSGFPWGDLVEVIAKAGIAALIYQGIRNGRSRWDPTVHRRRGPDGRFRSSRRSARGRRRGRRTNRAR